MKRAMLFLLLLAACELDAARNYRVYKLTWTCVSPEGCERAQEAMLVDRATIADGSVFVRFESTRDPGFDSSGQRVPSDELPAECSWLHGFFLFGFELEPSRFCGTSNGFELELSIPQSRPHDPEQLVGGSTRNRSMMRPLMRSALVRARACLVMPIPKTMPVACVSPLSGE